MGLSSEPPDTHNPTTTQISFHSLSGQLAPETLRLVGYIGSHQVLILVDGGSSHKFIQESLALRFGLLTRTSTPLSVIVGNGQHLPCNHLCESIPVSIQNIIFTIDLHVLPLCGANLVLDVQWLKSLNPILTDYNSLSMQFFHNG